jgi:RNA polymerase sigma factor (TIGR02999 family)
MICGVRGASAIIGQMADTDMTRILRAAGEGDSDAASALLPLVYEQLRAIARQRMAGERQGGRAHTLQATALVHEAYARLVGSPSNEPKWDSKAHFFVAAAEAMRRILIEHARAKLAEKRGGSDRRRLDLAIADVADLAAEHNAEEILALDEAFVRLQEQEPRAAEVVRLRFYAGLSVDEAAAALGVSPRTVELDWSYARAWLFRALRARE